MPVVNITQAKRGLPHLIEAVESGAEQEIIIVRHGRPAAKLVAVGARPAGQRVGVAKGKFTVPDTIDTDEAQIAALFSGQGQ